MGSKKRESSSVEESGVEVVEHNQRLNSDVDNVGTEPSSKRMKKEKRKKEIEKPEGESWDEVNAASTSTSSHCASVNSMERRKQRKMLDKERHLVEATKNESVPEKLKVELKSGSARGALTVNGSGASLPEFHIGVFKDLSAADASTRQAAAKAMVLELREVQNAYDKLEHKDEVEDKSKLEAEKDDGLNNCAPSVRYAVRRLIRGVSSSREVRFLVLINCVFYFVGFVNFQR